MVEQPAIVESPEQASKPLQFGLGKVFCLVLFAAVALAMLWADTGFLVLSFLVLGSLAGALIGPQDVYSSSISGGIGGSLGFWLAAPLSLSWGPHASGFRNFFGNLELLLLGSFCFLFAGFIAGTSVGAVVGLLRLYLRDIAARVNRRCLQFELATIFSVVFTAAMLFAALRSSGDVRIFFTVACASLIGMLVGPRTIAGSSIYGGIGGAVGFWVAGPFYHAPELWASSQHRYRAFHRPDFIAFACAFEFIFSSVAAILAGCIAGACIGFVAGLLRQYIRKTGQ